MPEAYVCGGPFADWGENGRWHGTYSMKFFMELPMSEVLMGYESVLALQPILEYIYMQYHRDRSVLKIWASAADK